jgi:hypothetical protein
LLKAMDALNTKYGMSTLAPATMLTAFKAAPTRIAFSSVPDFEIDHGKAKPVDAPKRTEPVFDDLGDD